MNVCLPYKEYARPDFFQGPTYIIFKEQSKIKNHKYPDHKEPENDNTYEISQFPPARTPHLPPAKKKHETAINEQPFNVKTEKRKGNKFWNELEGGYSKQPPKFTSTGFAHTTNRQASGLLKKQKKVFN